jgi:hypothetical protein
MGNYSYDSRTGQYYPDNNNGDRVFKRAAQGALLGLGVGALTGNIGRGAGYGALAGTGAGLLGLGGGKSRRRSKSRSRKSRRRLGKKGKKSRY